MKVKLIFGSDTGNTDYVVDTYIINLLDPFEVQVVEVHNLKPEDWETNDLIILGIPTWYDGELQSDWEAYFDEFKYDESKGLLNENYFYGLALDEDNESDLTFYRVEKWVQQLKQELAVGVIQSAQQ